MTDARRARRVDTLSPDAFAAQVSDALMALGIDDEEVARLAARFRDALEREPLDAETTVALLTLPNAVQATRRIWHLIAYDILAAAAPPSDRPGS